MGFQFSSEQFLELTALRNDENYSQMYLKIYEFTENYDGGDEFSRVREWFRVASQANADDGSAPSDLIRDYTAWQILLRTGREPTDAQLDKASDAIAESIYLRYVLTSSTIPATIEEIAQIDSSRIIESLQEDGYDVDLSAWSGNLLFVGLGSTTPLDENLLVTPSDTYDLIVSAAALARTSGLDLTLSTLESAWNTFPNLPFSNAFAASSLIDLFLDEAYGLRAITSAHLFANVTSGGPIVSVDQQGGDTSVSGIDAARWIGGDVLHAGDRDDDIIGGLGKDFIDGGSGHDRLSFEAESEAFGKLGGLLWLFANQEAAVPFSGEFVWENGDGTIVFDVEEIYLTNGDDRLLLSEFSALESVNAGDSSPAGDTIDLSTFAEHGAGALQVNLQQGAISHDSNFLIAEGFENAIGSSGNDHLTGDDNSNLFAGGQGDDIIEGGAGVDYLYFGSASGGVSVDLLSGTGTGGEAEGDTYQNIEGAVGTRHDDRFVSSGTAFEYFAGGEGDDVFVIEGGEFAAVVWGGSGADEIKFLPSARGNAGILVVEVDGLTLDNFHSFRVSEIGLPSDFDWSAIDVVVLNPDSSDTYVWAEHPNDPRGGESVFEDLFATAEYHFEGGYIDWSGGEVGDPPYVEAFSEWIELAYAYSVDRYMSADFLGSGVDRVFTQVAPFGLPGFVRGFTSLPADPGDNELVTDFGFGLTAQAAFRTQQYQNAFGTTFREYLWLGVVAKIPDEDEQDLIDDGIRDFIQLDEIGEWNKDQIKSFTPFEGVMYDTGFTIGNPDEPGGYFIAGGALRNGTLVADGTSRVIAPEVETGFSSLVDGYSSQIVDITPTHSGTASSETFSTFSGHDVVLAGGGDDTISSTSGNDTVFGQDGADWIDGGSGADLIIGGSGSDSLNGSSGNDIVFGDEGNDTLNGGGDNDELNGGSGADLIVGGTGSDTLLGGIGNDDLQGGDGDDLLLGEDGNDSLSGGKDRDLLVGGSGDDYLNGNSGDDTLEGSSGNDTLEGTSGNDVLEGGAGWDVLTGGSGADVFVFMPDAADGRENRITDFSVGDVILFKGFEDIQSSASLIEDFLEIDPAGNGVLQVFGVLVSIDNHRVLSALDLSDLVTDSTQFA